MKYDNYEDLISFLASYPEGVAMGELEVAFPRQVNRRTLQRWLNALIEQNKVERLGAGRSTRYALLTIQVAEAEQPDICLSSEAKAVHALVTQPLVRRKPVGYQYDFLNRYRPNESFYLDQTTRDELLRYGQALNRDELAGTFARQIANRLLIDLSWNSSRLEGNTYSLLETERLVVNGISAEGKNALETQMILNHKIAIEFLIDADSEVAINRYTLLNLHAMLANNLLADQSACGRLRHIAVGIGQTTFLPLDNPHRIEEYFEQVLATAQAIENPFEQAFFMLVHLPYLQPFEDVNKRVSRLAASIPLIQHNLCPISFVDVPQNLYISGVLAVYELNRVELLRDVFVWAYKRSCERYSAVRQTLGEPDLFRLRFKEQLFEVVHQVLKQAMNKSDAIRFIQTYSEHHIQHQSKARFIEAVEAELLSLHEGNFARYKVRPSEFYRWYEGWRA